MIQPIVTDITMADGIFAKHILVQKAFTWVPQHSHEWDHISLISAGKLAAFCGEQFLGTFEAPRAIMIKAGQKHTFHTLADNTVITCIHRIDRTGEIDVEEEHEFVRT